MPESRPLLRTPFRRVSVSLVLAVAIHVVLAAGALWLLQDLIQPDPTVPPRMTQQRFEEIIRDLPIIQQTAVPSSLLDRQAIEHSPAWAQFSMSASDYRSLPIVTGWSWSPDVRLGTPINAAGAVSRSKPPGRAAD